MLHSNCRSWIPRGHDSAWLIYLFNSNRLNERKDGEALWSLDESFLKSRNGMMPYSQVVVGFASISLNAPGTNRICSQIPDVADHTLKYVFTREVMFLLLSLERSVSLQWKSTQQDAFQLFRCLSVEISPWGTRLKPHQKPGMDSF